MSFDDENATLPNTDVASTEGPGFEGPSFEGRMADIGFDVTQMLIDEDGTIAPPPSARASDVLASLPSLRVLDRRLDDREPDSLRGALLLGDTLGEGGMGSVRAAFDPAIGRHVAVKMILDSAAQERATMELLREARVMGGLAHPNIVPLYAIGRDPHGSLLLVMKRIEGQRWSDLMHTRDLRFHLDVLSQVCNAVHFAHSRGILHRDLKPHNVMLGSFGEVYLLDWGIAVRFGDSDESDAILPHAAAVRHVAGTPGYMAPEMAAGSGDQLEPRTDVYLLGAILHEIVTGRAPHEEATVIASLRSAFAGRAPELGDDVPRPLAALCQQALARSAANRPESAATFRDALADFLAHHATIEITHQALQRLAQLEQLLEQSSSSPELIRKLAVEARFGFRQVLRAFDDAEAQAGLSRLLTCMASYHLARGNRDEAAALIDELADPPAALRERLDELTRQQAEERDRVLRLEKLEQEVDVRVQAPQRMRIALLLTGLTLLMSAALVGTYLSGLSLGHAELLGGLALLGVVLSAAWLRVRRDPHGAVTRRFVLSVLAVNVALAVQLTAALFSEVPIVETFATMMLLTAAGVAVAAVTFHRGFALTAIIYALCFVATKAWPAGAFAIFSAGHIAGFASMAWVWLRAGRDDPSARPPPGQLG